ncbi:HEPN domain-containing protein [Salinicoccus roseus]|uniref:Uncharacterized protein n=1 Tax=Salinicoccus roseus TaxID=45670 RepID=A0A265E9Q2_9STAP|nr:HEPN domain-containing protein [Salinicoccus roseus]OZT78260.1 hypothetical protein CFN03_02995 [Salinicoccus roseus]
MSKKFDVEYGNWCFGGKNICLNGTLTLNYEENEFELILYSDEKMEIPYYTDIVYGKTHQGHSFTLYKCSVYGSKRTSIVHDFKEKFSYKVNFEYLLEGDTYKEGSNIKINEVYFSVTNLDKWAFQDNVKIEKENSGEYKITTTNIKNLIHTNEEFKFAILYSTRPSNNYKMSGALEIKTTTMLMLKFFEPTSLERTHSLIKQIKDFITLCTGKKTYIEYINASPKQSNELDYETSLKIYGQAIDFLNIEKVPDLKKHNAYISLNSIRKDFNICMQNWFEKNEKLTPVIDLYLSSLYHHTSLERHFLNMVQALEAYHRLTRNNQILSKEEHAEKISSIVESVPDEHQEWVKQRLAFSNEPTLHHRLEDLLTPISNNGLHEYDFRYHYLFRFQDKEKVQIIRDIKNTRNYNTHFDERLKKKAIKEENLYQLVSLLKLMMEFYLLNELEISEEDILELTWAKSQQLSLQYNFLESAKEDNINL